MSRSRLWWTTAVIITIAVGLDQLTKEWATNRLSRDRSIDVLPTIDFDLAHNSGFSFSTGSGNGSLVGILVIGICVFIGLQIWRETVVARAGVLAAILGGAIGNLLDRIFRADDGPLSGEVVDFIDVSWYAVFNVADMFVVCGCVVFVIYELRHRTDRDHTEDESAAQAPAEGIST